MSNKINLAINTQLSFASYQEAVSAQALLVRTILCDDIPFGYESSHRIASMLFAYLARK